MQVTALIITEVFIPGALVLLSLIAFFGSLVDLAGAGQFWEGIAKIASQQIDTSVSVAVAFVFALLAYLLGVVSNYFMYRLPLVRRQLVRINLDLCGRYGPDINQFGQMLGGVRLLPLEKDHGNEADVLESMDTVLGRMWGFVSAQSAVGDREMMYYRNIGRIARASIPALALLCATAVFCGLKLWVSSDLEWKWIVPAGIAAVFFPWLAYMTFKVCADAAKHELIVLVNSFLGIVSSRK